MYYILNHTDQIIAVDDALLNYLNLDNLEDLTREIVFNKLKITSSSINKNIQIHTRNKILTFTMQKISLNSMFGKLNLVHLIPNEETISSNDDLILNKETQDINNTKELKSSPKDFSTLILPNTAKTTIDEITLQSVTTSTDEKKEPFIKAEDITLKNSEVTPVKKFSIDNKTSFNPEPIIIHLTKVSNQIGISTDDYTTFLNEYIDTAISLEPDLQSNDTQVRKNTIETLIQLANVLHLPQVNDMISTLNTQSVEERNNTIERFYNVLARLITKIDSNYIQSKEKINTVNENTKEELVPVSSLYDTADTIQGFGKLQLDNIKPIYFNFQLTQAADDLMLPIELIEEFVHDFINQAHTETKKMLTAYEKGDLATIQEIGHLLKGASSNLRISILSDTLSKIQFCEDSTKLEKLIKQYWGQFLSFEQQIISR